MAVLTQQIALHLMSPYLLENYAPIPDAGCWLWLGAWSAAGYGKAHNYGTRISRVKWDEQAHRLFYAYHVGDIPDELFVCHKCDTPACVNPHHLFLGTPAENTADMVRKGRKPTHRRVISGDEVRAVFQSSLAVSKLAKQYGVSITTINAIRNRRTRQQETDGLARIAA